MLFMDFHHLICDVGLNRALPGSSPFNTSGTGCFFKGSLQIVVV
jgi:hypothetical protein